MPTKLTETLDGLLKAVPPEPPKYVFDGLPDGMEATEKGTLDVLDAMGSETGTDTERALFLAGRVIRLLRAEIDRIEENAWHDGVERDLAD